MQSKEDSCIEINQIPDLHNNLFFNNEDDTWVEKLHSVDPMEVDNKLDDILDVYLAYINYKAKNFISPATIKLFRLLYLIDENTNNEECLSFAKDAILLIRIILTCGNIVRYAMLKSGNLLSYLQRMEKKKSRPDRRVDLQTCCAEFFSEIDVCMSGAQEDDLLNLNNEFLRHSYLPDPEIQGIPWKVEQELVNEIHQHGLQGSVLKFLDTLYISLDKVLEPCLSKLQQREKAGGRAFLFKFLIEKDELFSFKSQSQHKSKQYAFKLLIHYSQVNQPMRPKLTSNQKYLKRMIALMGRMSSTSIRRARSYSYKDIRNRTSRLEIKCKQFVELFKDISDRSKQPVNVEDIFDTNVKDYCSDDYGHSDEYEKLTCEEKLILFEQNFQIQSGFQNICILFRDIRQIYGSCVPTEESGISWITNANMIIENEAVALKHNSLEDLKTKIPDYNHLNPHIPYICLTYENTEYYWTKKKSGSTPPLYELCPKSPFGLHSSNPDSNTYEFFPATTEFGMLEVIEIKQYETTNTTGCYTQCTYSFNNPAHEDVVTSVLVLQTYLKPRLCHMYPNYLATCSLRLGDGIDRRMVFLESGTCYSIACPRFGEQLNEDVEDTEVNKQQEAIEFFFRKHEPVFDDLNRLVGWYVLCKTTIVLEHTATSAKFACVDIGIHRLEVRNKSDQLIDNELKFRLHLFELKNFTIVGEQNVLWEEHQFFPFAQDNFDRIEFGFNNFHFRTSYPRNIRELVPKIELADFTPLSIAINNHGSLSTKLIREKTLSVELSLSEDCPYRSLYDKLPEKYVISW